MTTPRPETSPIDQLNAADQFPPRLSPGDRHDADLGRAFHWLHPLGSRPRRHRKTWRS